MSPDPDHSTPRDADLLRLQISASRQAVRFTMALPLLDLRLVQTGYDTDPASAKSDQRC